MYRGFRHMGFGHMGFGYTGIWTFVLLALLVIGVIIYLTKRSKKPYQDPNPDEALDILDRRYAKGEINTKEYREKKKELKEENYEH